MVQHENLSFGTLRLCTGLFGFDRKCQFWGKNKLRVVPKLLFTFANMAHKCRFIDIRTSPKICLFILT